MRRKRRMRPLKLPRRRRKIKISGVGDVVRPRKIVEKPPSLSEGWLLSIHVGIGMVSDGRAIIDGRAGRAKTGRKSGLVV